MHKIMDFIINILRWPAAFYLLFSVPALLNVYHYFDFYTFKFLVVGVGFIFFRFLLLCICLLCRICRRLRMIIG